MEVKIIDSGQRVLWETYVDQSPTIAWQSFDWSVVVKKHYRVEFFPIAAFENSMIRGILPLYKVRNIRGKINLISVPYAVAGGIVGDNPAIESRLLDEAIQLSKKYNSANITFKQYKHKIEGNLRTDDSYYNRELDLTVGQKQLWQGLADINKRNLESNYPADLKLIWPHENVDAFYNLLIKHHHNSGIPCVGKRWIKDLIAFKMYSVAALESNGSIVAATMVKEHKKTVSFPFTCISDLSESSKIDAYRLYWELIKMFADQGKEIFHSGRIPQDDDTYAYRLGWGGKKYGYYYQYYPNTTGTTESTSKRGKKRVAVSALWKKLPLQVTRLAGPHLVKYFP